MNKKGLTIINSLYKIVMAGIEPGSLYSESDGLSTELTRAAYHDVVYTLSIYWSVGTLWLDQTSWILLRFQMRVAILKIKCGKYNTSENSKKHLKGMYLIRKHHLVDVTLHIHECRVYLICGRSSTSTKPCMPMTVDLTEITCQFTVLRCLKSILSSVYYSHPP